MPAAAAAVAARLSAVINTSNPEVANPRCIFVYKSRSLARRPCKVRTNQFVPFSHSPPTLPPRDEFSIVWHWQ
ncbi:hypothetical protein BS50DRAFT_573613 [Corynespora cassiicola Philippines]|uniref:Uncharacterized protein n=1 Tax=Corynespora cassiicola Philippines TaxID=1448308 RepID=A0A2T2NN08_CORCC|nr:hypothetical protein BS50DRAFT_573613 [Corynespora cassiicola Philippines]